MTIRVEVVGDRLDLADELRDEFHAAALQAVNEASEVALTEVQHRLSRRRGTRATAAPEGEPPEFETGDLLRSFRPLPARIQGRVATGGIYSNHPGANRLEFGFTDRRGIRTLAHPYVAPAMEAAEAKVQQVFRDHFGAE